jgi:hypothetical protein
MQQGEILILVLVGLVALIGGAIWLSLRRRRTRQLRTAFGEEYDRTVELAGRRSKAEANLAERRQRVASLNIRPLTADEVSDFTREWQQVKSLFVDSPPEAVLHADRMMVQMLAARGFSSGDFERRHEDLTVDHPLVARHYRAGRGIAERLTQGSASTEDLRQAIHHYEALFDEMIGAAKAPAGAQVAHLATGEDRRPATLEPAAPVEGR